MKFVSSRVVLSCGLAIAGVLSGCPASKKMSVPPGEVARISGLPSQSPQPAPSAAVLHDGAQYVLDLADGSACESSAACESNICEGGNCDGTRLGVCASAERLCTEDLVAYCGCDGRSFYASSTCPGIAFSSRGECGMADDANPGQGSTLYDAGIPLDSSQPSVENDAQTSPEG